MTEEIRISQALEDGYVVWIGGEIIAAMRTPEEVATMLIFRQDGLSFQYFFPPAARAARLWSARVLL